MNSESKQRSFIVQEDLERIVSVRLPWELLSGKTVLIAGANGFLPAYMVETLLYLNEKCGVGIQVIALVRNKDRAALRFSHHAGRADLEFVIQDVCDPYIGERKPHYIIHAASQASPKYYGVDPVGTFEANVTGIRRMLQLAQRTKATRLLYFSSGEVYGQPGPDTQCTNETQYGYLDPLNIRSCYAEGKRAAETLCSCWHHQFGVPAVIVRPFHTYGPGMSLDDGRVFADFVSDVVNGRDLVLTSDGNARRAFCYLADATLGFFTVLFSGELGQAYNIGSDVDCSITELAQILCDLFPEKHLKVISSQHTKTVVNYLPSPITKICPIISKARLLNWSPSTSVREGFLRTVRSFEK